MLLWLASFCFDSFCLCSAFFDLSGLGLPCLALLRLALPCSVSSALQCYVLCCAALCSSVLVLLCVDLIYSALPRLRCHALPCFALLSFALLGVAFLRSCLVSCFPLRFMSPRTASLCLGLLCSASYCVVLSRAPVQSLCFAMLCFAW